MLSEILWKELYARASSIHDFREISIRGPQNISVEDYQLRVMGLVQQPQSFNYPYILSNYTAYEKVVTLHCVEGWSVTILWEGIRITELLQDTGIQFNATTS